LKVLWVNIYFNEGDVVEVGKVYAHINSGDSDDQQIDEVKSEDTTENNISVTKPIEEKQPENSNSNKKKKLLTDFK
jgi:hypothetical protein